MLAKVPSQRESLTSLINNSFQFLSLFLCRPLSFRGMEVPYVLLLTRLVAEVASKSTESSVGTWCFCRAGSYTNRRIRLLSPHVAVYGGFLIKQKWTILAVINRSVYTGWICYEGWLPAKALNSSQSYACRLTGMQLATLHTMEKKTASWSRKHLSSCLVVLLQMLKNMDTRKWTFQLTEELWSQFCFKPQKKVKYKNSAFRRIWPAKS